MPGKKLTHFDESGRAKMVDVTGKDVTAREAVAVGSVPRASATRSRLMSVPDRMGCPGCIPSISRRRHFH